MEPAPQIASPSRRGPLDGVAALLASGLGLGRSPWAPGTIGSLGGAALAGGLRSIGVDGWFAVGVTGLLLVCGVYLCGRAARAAGATDPGWIVLDEIAPFPLLFAGLAWSWPVVVLGFALFRGFDILKPGPVKWAERLRGGWGIMADDLVAGLLATGILRSLIAVWPALGA
jgi:phosphatidylglycerophosphatase A